MLKYQSMTQDTGCKTSLRWRTRAERGQKSKRKIGPTLEWMGPRPITPITVELNRCSLSLSGIFWAIMKKWTRGRWHTYRAKLHTDHIQRLIGASKTIIYCIALSYSESSSHRWIHFFRSSGIQVKHESLVSLNFIYPLPERKIFFKSSSTSKVVACW